MTATRRSMRTRGIAEVAEAPLLRERKRQKKNASRSTVQMAVGKPRPQQRKRDIATSSPERASELSEASDSAPELKPSSPSSISESEVKKKPIKKATKPVSTANAKKRVIAKPVPTAKQEDAVAAQEEETSEAIKRALERPLPVNSDYVPLPWKGRLGYACLNTYLRNANPPVFSSRTCRIASILENRHPLQDPSQPYHATKNRPDRSKPSDPARGLAYVQGLGLANARDIIKMLRWNHKYGIRFLRLSSEMFPFASHEEYGYKLGPFASETLAAAGRVVAELGHRVTTHPGQFTQLGSPRKEVISSSVRDLEYHNEMLSLLKLPPQQDRDAVMILHMGGVFGDKDATLQRFRENYQKLSPGVKKRLVLENDDVSWSVHDLLPICEELNIPLVLDFHHHNIIFDSSKLREGTKDIMELFPRILATWRRKQITPKMHYSEPTDGAITPRQRRKHSPRVATLPPCPPDMDLMIEAKDKEQAVFELMKKYRLPGHENAKQVIPHERQDENKTGKLRGKAKATDESVAEAPAHVTEDEVGMGGPEGRVYWPLGHEEWLRPAKRLVKKKEEGGEGKEGNNEPPSKTAKTPSKRKK